MNCSSPKSSLAKLGFNSNKQKPIRLMVLGQTGVGKTGEISGFVRSKMRRTFYFFIVIILMKDRVALDIFVYINEDDISCSFFYKYIWDTYVCFHYHIRIFSYA